jgi:hypothetical protein
MPLYSDANGFPEAGFPVLSNESDKIVLNTLYPVPQRYLNYTMDIVGDNRLSGALVIAGAMSGVTSLSMSGALSGVTTLGASGLVTLSSDTAPLSLTGTNAVLNISGANASIGTVLSRVNKAYFKNLDIQNRPTINNGEDDVALMSDLRRYALLMGRSGDILKIDELQEFTLNNGVKIDGLIIKDTGINFEAGATTRIFKDGSNNLCFTDAIAGTKTLTDLINSPMVYPGAGIALSTGSGWSTSITDNSTNWNTAYGWGNHAGLYANLSHTHGNITNDGKIGSTSGLMIKTTTNGVLTTLAAGSSGQFLRYDGTWDTPAGTYSLPLAANGTRGGIQIGYSATGANIPLQLSSEKAYVALTKAAIDSVNVGTAQYQIPITGATPFTPTWTTATNLVGASGLNSLTYASTSFVKMTGAGTFALDTNTYLTTVTAHNLLSTTHGDTLAGSVARGSVIVGNSTPKWSVLAFPSTPTGKALVATATDVAWSAAAVILEGDSRLTDARTPLSHTHGDISNAGAITSTAITPASGDYIILSDTSASSVLKRGIAIGTADGTFLSKAGTWATPASTIAYGTDYQIPYMNTADNGFLYSSKFKYDTKRLIISDSVDQIFIGIDAGYSSPSSSTTGNIFIGNYAGYSNTSGAYGNVFIGNNSGRSNTIGDSNLFVGASSGYSHVSGLWNTMIGPVVGYYSTGTANVFVGGEAGYGSSSGAGSENTYIGRQSGYMGGGSNNVFIGSYSGYYETSSNKLFIDNQVRSSAANDQNESLIYGEFSSTASNQLLKINGQFRLPLISTASTSYVLYWNNSTGAVTYGSVSSGMTYPGAGIPLSTGSAWGTSLAAVQGDLVYGYAASDWRKLAAGTIGHVLTVDSNSRPAWVAPSTLVYPGGSGGDIQYNNSGFAGTSKLSYDSTYSILTLTGFSGSTNPPKIYLYPDSYGLRFKYADGTSQYMDLTYSGANIFQLKAGSQVQLQTTYNGATLLGYAGSTKLTTRTDGISLTGDLYLNNGEKLDWNSGQVTFTQNGDYISVNGSNSSATWRFKSGNKSSFGTTGYAYTTEGFIIQWGVATSTSDSNESFTFSGLGGFSFPNACRLLIADLAQGNSKSSISVNGFTINRLDAVDGNIDFSWIAIGY